MLHPSIGPQNVYQKEKVTIPYLSATQQHQLDCVPSVGVYRIDRIIDGTKRPATEAQSKAVIAKYLNNKPREFQHPSIPNLRRDVDERPEIIKPPPHSTLALQSLRNVDQLPKTEYGVGPATYVPRLPNTQ